MDFKDAIIANGFLQYAAPETVFAWFEKHHNINNPNIYLGSNIPKELERTLSARNDICIDMALAAWGDDCTTARVIYERHCSRKACSTQWPPAPSTNSYSILAALLAGKSAGVILFDLGADSLPVADNNDETSADKPATHFDALIDRFLETHDANLLALIHSNPWSGVQLLKLCANREGVYGRIFDEDWLQLLAYLGRNPGLQRIDTTDSESPDLQYWEIHKLFVHAITIAPKSDYGASAVWGLLIDMPTSATKGAYPDLEKAIQAWNVDIEIEPEASNNYGCMSRDLAKEDGMTPSERVRFHLLRHYYHRETSCSSNSRVHRLAAYATTEVSDDFIKNIHKYASLDGAAFFYATSFNSSIWNSSEAIDAMEEGIYSSLQERSIARPEDMGEVRRIRDSVAPGWWERYMESMRDPPPDRFKELMGLIETTSQRIERNVQVASKINVWAMIVLAVLVILT